eukprot:Tamp_15904.p1 GENE.Tamp_15904~~Tamp_15904.p1  ORF type:complete len:398 (+),score=71.40 Tamp_15904:111-1196(+)
MVGQSEPAFRMLCRAQGCAVCSTEMIDAAGYARSERYRAQYPFAAADRPLIVQLGGSDPSDLATAAALAAAHCDGVELNVGCPQRCARKGGYGAFLMDKRDVLRQAVEAMATAIQEVNPLCACCVKIRCFDDVAQTVSLAQMLVEAGCQVLTVHGRTRGGGGGKRTGKWLANWDWIREVKQAVGIPVVSNGNIRVYGDIEACLAHTGADAVMSGCGALKRPYIFSPSLRPAGSTLVPRSQAPGASRGGNQWELRLQCALLYLPFATEYDAHPRQISKHLQDMVPKAVLRRPAAAALSRQITALAAGTDNHASPDALAALAEELRAALEDLEQNKSSLPAAAHELSDSDDDAGGGGGGGGGG